jgi:hypothetical protein
MSAAARPAASARGCALAATVAGLAGCTLPVSLPFLSPHDSCRAVNESLNAAVPPGQSIADLQARGIRLNTPLTFPPGTWPPSAQASGAAVQGMIGIDGAVIPGSPRTLKSIGEAQLASAMEAGALSMRFEFDAGARPAMPVPFTATYAACSRS